MSAPMAAQIDFGGKTIGFSTPAGAFFANERIRQEIDLLTARINYRFGVPLSLIARY